jgi:hypothetical protein
MDHFESMFDLSTGDECTKVHSSGESDVHPSKIRFGSIASIHRRMKEECLSTKKPVELPAPPYYYDLILKYSLVNPDHPLHAMSEEELTSRFTAIRSDSILTAMKYVKPTTDLDKWFQVGIARIISVLPYMGYLEMITNDLDIETSVKFLQATKSCLDLESEDERLLALINLTEDYGMTPKSNSCRIHQWIKEECISRLEPLSDDLSETEFITEIRRRQRASTDRMKLISRLEQQYIVICQQKLSDDSFFSNMPSFLIDMFSGMMTHAK